MLAYIRDKVKPDIIVWNGDNAPHLIWKDTPEVVIDATLKITKMLRATFD
jgi:hypothetical protein